jgi:hypothetical protein
MTRPSGFAVRAVLILLVAFKAASGLGEPVSLKRTVQLALTHSTTAVCRS